MVKVYIITATYNGQKDTLDFLNSLKLLRSDGVELKCCVVDNGSTDNTLHKISKNYPQVEIIQMGRNTGFTGGYNRGMEYALARGADFILLINNDTVIVDKNLLHSLLETINKHPKIGAVSPKIWFAKGYEYFKDKYHLNRNEKVIWYAGGDFDWNNLMSKHRGIDEVDKGKYDTVEKVNFVSGCCLLVRKEMISEVGLLDNELFAYFEDNDWLMRMKRYGWETWYDGKVGLDHKVSQTSGVSSDLTDYYLTRNRLRFAKQYAPLRTKLAIARQAVGFLITGRKFQQKGVIDFLLNRWGNLDREYKLQTELSWPYELSIAVVNYKTSSLVKELLRSLKQDGFKEEVVVVDNASADNCERIVKREFPSAVYIPLTRNLGFSGGYNQAIKACRGKYILLLNSDIKVRKGSLSRLLRAIRTVGDRAVLLGKLILPNGQVQKSCFRLPTIRGAIEEYFLNKRGSYLFYIPNGRTVSQVDGGVMACFLIPRAVIDKVGLLSEETQLYYEDIEYCRRLARANVPVYFVSSAVFDHEHGASTRTLGSQEIHQKLVVAAKWYHGKLYYALLTCVLKWGQIWQKLCRQQDL